jgi:hypothetical protein
MMNYNRIKQLTILFTGFILSVLILNGCKTPQPLPQMQHNHYPFSGIHRLLLLDCNTVPSNINSGIFSASKSEIHMLSLGICESFRDVLHIQLSYIPQKEMIPETSDYDALLSARIWWQFCADCKKQSPRHQFDLIVQLQLHTKNENNRIQTRNYYITAMRREGFVVQNQIFFCKLAEPSFNSLPGNYMMPKLAKSIFQLTRLHKDISVKAPELIDTKSKILFEAKAYKALIHYIVTSQLAKNNSNTVPLFIDARLSDAIDILFQDRQANHYEQFTKKYHAEIFALGLCFEKTGQIKKALGCYRFVIKYAAEYSHQSAEGISRCLNILAVRDHIQLAGLNIQPDIAFKLRKTELKNFVPNEKAMAATEMTFIEKKPLPVEEMPIKETFDSFKNEDKTYDKESDIIAIQMMIDQWLAAWRSMISKDYFRFYANDFQPEENQTFNQWRKQRKERLKRKYIFVSIVGQAEINLISDVEAEVLFVQDFESKGYYYKDRTKKRLLLVKKDADWRIKKEEVLDVIP